MLTSPSQRKLQGLLVRRERWGLSWWGRLLLLLGVLGAIVGIHLSLYPFLAVTRPLRGEVLVVEGWIPVYSLHLAAEEYARGGYRRLLVVRALYEGEEGVVHGKHTGEYAVRVLERCGVPAESIAPVYFRGSESDRTYHSAVEVKEWLSQRGDKIGSTDVATLGPHARRSRLLYQRAFGDTTSVGVIALADPTYDSSRWWRSSQGAREVLGEAMAYLYARVVFWGEEGDGKRERVVRKA